MTIEAKRAAAMNLALSFVNLRFNVLTAKGVEKPFESDFFSKKEKIDMGSDKDIKKAFNSMMEFIETGEWLL